MAAACFVAVATMATSEILVAEKHMVSGKIDDLGIFQFCSWSASTMVDNVKFNGKDVLKDLYEIYVELVHHPEGGPSKTAFEHDR